MLTEANIDIWPSPDMRRIPGHGGEFVYGLLPLKLTNGIREFIARSIRNRSIKLTNREK